MKPEDQKRFLLAYSKTRVSLPSTTLTDSEEAIRAEVFWEELEGYPIERVEMAFQKARGKFKFFPKPVEIIEFIQEDYEIEYRKTQTETSVMQLEYKEAPMDREKAKQFFIELNKHLNTDTSIKSILEGEEAEEFERKRELAKERVRDGFGRVS